MVCLRLWKRNAVVGRMPAVAYLATFEVSLIIVAVERLPTHDLIPKLSMNRCVPGRNTLRLIHIGAK